MRFLDKLTKEEINELPLRRYEGSISFIASPDGVDTAIEKLRMEQVLGFDIESKPAFKKGEKHPPALVQVAGSDQVFIFRLVEMGLPEGLCEIMADESVTKVGVSLNDDVKDLKELRSFVPRGFLDLGNVSKHATMQHHGLKGLAAVLLGFRISKSAQRSNWASDHLTDKQIRYAATDAWVSRVLYLEMIRRGLVQAMLESQQKAKDEQPEFEL